MTSTLAPPRRRVLAWIGTGLFLFVLALGALLASLALITQFSGLTRTVTLAALALGLVAAFVLRWRRSRRAGWGALIVTFGAVGLWYQTLQPSNDRDWTFDVVHGVTGDIAGDIVTLHDVRAFRWTSDSEAAQTWETRIYDLSKLDSVDMFTSVWASPLIAHVLVSFGFSDGQHVVFSFETRKQKGEVYSTIGGFFREYEDVLIAADEEDIIKLRTNYRKEDVSIFPIDVRPETMRTLFLSYVEQGNRLAAHPAFYNTITDNCAMSIYRVVRTFDPSAPLDIRLLLTGELPDYVNEQGLLKGTGTMAERRARAAISAKAQAIPPGVDYSTWIRQ